MIRPRGVSHLGELATADLKRLWDERPNNSGRTTIYHFGFSELDGSIVVDAFRSKEEFKRERLAADEVYFKPDIEQSLCGEGNAAEKFQEIMEAQRAEQEVVPAKDRVNIGGECVVMEITPAGCYQYVAFQFSDFEDQRDQSERMRDGI